MIDDRNLFTAHAKRRMIGRGYTAEQVLALVLAPEVSYPDQHGNACKCGSIDGRWTRVVISAESGRIITVIDPDADH